MKLLLAITPIMILLSCKFGTSDRSRLKVMSLSCRGRKSLCKNINPSTITKSFWPVGMSQVGAMGGGIATEQALKNAYPKAVTQKVQKEFNSVQPKIKANPKKSKSDFIVFWDIDELSEALSKTCNDFKTDSKSCLIELSRDLVRDLDGEYITQKGFIRSGIEVKRFESDSADLCSTRTQEVELKSGCALPLAAAAGSILGAVNVYMDVGVRVTTKTNLSNKTVTDNISPMFECGAKCDLPFLKAEFAVTEEGIKFERHITINSLNVPKEIGIQRRQENTLSWNDIGKWVNEHKNDAPSTFKSYMEDYLEKKRKFWTETDPELTKWPEIMCNVNP